MPHDECDLNTAIPRVLKFLRTEAPDRIELIRLIEMILLKSVPSVDCQHDLYLVALEQPFTIHDSQEIGIDEYDTLVKFIREHPHSVNHKVQAQRVKYFEEYAEEEVLFLFLESTIE